MSNICGNSVQTIRISTLQTCSQSSTYRQVFIGTNMGTYGYLRVLQGYVHLFTQGLSQVVLHKLHLLLSKLSLLSTPPIITKTKDL